MIATAHRPIFNSDPISISTQILYSHNPRRSLSRSTATDHPNSKNHTVVPPCWAISRSKHVVHPAGLSRDHTPPRVRRVGQQTLVLLGREHIPRPVAGGGGAGFQQGRHSRRGRDKRWFGRCSGRGLSGEGRNKGGSKLPGFRHNRVSRVLKCRHKYVFKSRRRVEIPD